MRGSAPGKVFVLGEYAALAGGPALVCAIEPRFEFGDGVVANARIHPESPAGRLVKDWELAPPAFRDPHEGRGGFGASTAQFLAAWCAQTEAPRADAESVEEVWSSYRAYAGLPAPSGADIVAQYLGGARWVSFERKGSGLRAVAESSPLIARLRLYSATGQAGRKTATHLHLGELARRSGAHETLHGLLRVILGEAQEALARGQASAFGASLDRYADALASEGLEHAEAALDRSALRACDGVLGAKGTGAMLSDAILVLCAPEMGEAGIAAVDALAKARGLGALGFLSPSQGLRVHSESRG